MQCKFKNVVLQVKEEPMSNHPAPHGKLPRGLESVPRSQSFEGRFGRLFRTLPPFDPPDDALIALGTTMIENPADIEERDAPSNNADVTAGYTYLGQFLD